MFSINIYLRFALIAVFFGGGIILWGLYGFVYSWPLILVGLFFVIGYILFGTVQSAAQMIQKNDFAGAEKRLNLSLSPKLLYVTNRAFYYIMKGSIAMNNKDTQKAEELFDHALNMKLPSDNEKAMVLLQLANINASKNKWQAAKKYHREVKKLKITESQVKAQVKEFDKVLSNRGQMKAAASMGRQGMMQMGGKRRRPKMR
jgi:tetratricopeptide (TPR) repeat protein